MEECISISRRPALDRQQRFSEEMRILLRGFEKLDVDNDGFVSCENIREFLASHGAREALSRHLLDEIFFMLDDNM